MRRDVLRDVGTLYSLELLRASKSPVLIAISLATPLTWLVLFGGLFDAGLGLRFEGHRYLTYVAPGLMVMMATFFALSSGVLTMTDRQVGFLKEVLVAPVGRMEIILGRTLGVCTIVSGQAFVLLGVPALLGQGPPMPYGVVSVAAVVAATSLVALAFVGLGMLMAVRGKSPQSFQSLVGLLTLPMFFLSGALLPISSLPAWAQVAAVVNPLAFAVDAARQAALGAEVGHWPFRLDMLGLVGFALFMLSLGARNLRER